MGVGVDESGHGELSSQADHPCGIADERLDLGVPADGDDSVATSGHGLRLGPGVVHGDDLSAKEDEVGGFRFCRCRTRQQENRGGEEESEAESMGMAVPWMVGHRRVFWRRWVSFWGQATGYCVDRVGANLADGRSGRGWVCQGGSGPTGGVQAGRARRGGSAYNGECGGDQRGACFSRRWETQ